MKQFKRGLLLLLVVVFATACAHTNGGGMASSNLDRIAKSGVLRVGTAANMPPLNMLSKSDVPMGLDIDLAREIALDVQKNKTGYRGLDDDFERDILGLIEKANQDLGG